MSNRRRPRSPEQPATPSVFDPPPVATIRRPTDAIAMIPYLLGFEPSESIVVVSLMGSRQRFGPIVRSDLDAIPELQSIARRLAGAAAPDECEDALIVAFSLHPEIADDAVRTVRESLEAAGICVVEAVRADGARWWSYTCDRGCCPPDGTPYDPTASPAAALAVAMGMGKADSRDALAQQFAPRSDPEQAMVNDAARRARVTLSVHGDDDRSAAVDDLVWLALGRPDLDSTTVAMLLGAVQDLRARDAVWSLMTRDDAAEHFELWRQVMRAADDDLMAPAGTLCAFAAWLSGQGAVAATAAAAVARVSPHYSFLALIVDILHSGMGPAAWDEWGQPGLAAVSAGSPNAGAAADDAAG
jgi:hypothetical protein